MVVTAIVMRETGNSWNLSDSSESLIPLALGLGVFLGSVISGYLIDRMGRMFIYKKSLFFAGIFGVASCFSNNLGMLTLLFFGVGFGLGKN